MKQDAKYIRWFEEIKIGDIPTVGGKNASQEKCIVNLRARESKFRLGLPELPRHTGMPERIAIGRCHYL